MPWWGTEFGKLSRGIWWKNLLRKTVVPNYKCSTDRCWKTLSWFPWVPWGRVQCSPLLYRSCPCYYQPQSPTVRHRHTQTQHSIQHQICATLHCMSQTGDHQIVPSWIRASKGTPGDAKCVTEFFFGGGGQNYNKEVRRQSLPFCFKGI